MGINLKLMIKSSRRKSNFDVSEFPGYTGKGGYGVAHKVPVKQADGTIKMVDKGVPPVKLYIDSK